MIWTILDLSIFGLKMDYLCTDSDSEVEDKTPRGPYNFNELVVFTNEKDFQREFR
jgi:hypothetical protein